VRSQKRFDAVAAASEALHRAGLLALSEIQP
jgi:hypothetical protein